LLLDRVPQGGGTPIELSGKIRDADLRIFPGAGHSLPVTHTDAVANAMRAFLNR
jgi:pimeloyl-ACP methyl ester carboxylesterase